MSKNNRILQSQQVLNALIAVVCLYLPLDLQNTRITARDIISVLGYASANRISQDAVCLELKEAPSANRLRELLAKALSDRITLQRALNRILRAQTPRFVKKGAILPCNRFDLDPISWWLLRRQKRNHAQHSQIRHDPLSRIRNGFDSA